MRKFLVPLGVVVALAIPAQAVAKTKHYAGTVTPSGTIGFNVIQKPHKKAKRVGSFRFDGIPVTCSDGAHVAHGIITFQVKLRKNKTFTFNASNSSTGSTAKVNGSLSAGTLELGGAVVIETGTTGTNCSSGVLNWTAARG
jgi:hypothetical protein